jgi:hypothetical protein
MDTKCYSKYNPEYTDKRKLEKDAFWQLNILIEANNWDIGYWQVEIY